MDHPDREGAVAHRGGHPLDRAGSDIANGEDTGPARLEGERRPVVAVASGIEAGALQIRAGLEEAVVVGGQGRTQPLGARGPRR